jgi:hypothetical protein
MPDLPSSIAPALAEEIRAVYAFYAALAPQLDPDHALGGKLLFAGLLNDQSCRMIRAANIAGAASLAVSSSPDELRKALHNGVVDFRVTSLDEAVRILKNEIRKRQPVAVAVQGVPLELVQEMIVRGLQPDLLATTPQELEPARAAFLERGSALVEPCSAQNLEKLRIWAVPVAWHARMAELDAQLQELLPPDAYAARRWLRLSRRYLGAPARKLRSVTCSDQLAAAFARILI